jgi:hypothetical protein
MICDPKRYIWRRAVPLLAVLLLAGPSPGAQPSLASGSVLAAAERLRPGEYIWAPEVAPEGPVLLVVSLATQRAVIYRNGVPIGISTVSTGRPGHATPTGVFTVLQRRVEHYSNLYNNAPMPYMQRLTWGGVALHGGNLPGYPASHGCIRLPQDFARLLYDITHLGMTVVITDRAAVPRIAPAQTMLAGAADPVPGEESWRPDAARTGPVSIVISASDRRLVVLRDGTVIGTAPVDIDGVISRTTAYVLAGGSSGGRTWLRVALPGQVGTQEPTELRGRIHVADGFRNRVEEILAPGATVVVTADSLGSGETGRAMTIVEEDRD